MKAVRAIVKGRVQGVGYRYFALEEADSLGLCGWVLNRPDRTVEILAQGDENDIDRYLERLRQGPPMGRVTDMLLTEEALDKDLYDFQVRH